MKLDDLLTCYFGATNLAQAGPAAIEAGLERAVVGLGLERDRRRRFALWSMLYLPPVFRILLRRSVWFC